MAKVSEIKLGLNIILGEGAVAPTAIQIAAALRAQADALAPAGGENVSETKPAAKAQKAKPAAKPKEEEENYDDSNDSATDSYGGDSDQEAGDDYSDDSDGQEGSESEGEESFEDEGSDDEQVSEVSLKEAIGLLKKVAEKKKKAGAMAIMKKVTGQESVHKIKKPEMMAKLMKALKAALK